MRESEWRAQLLDLARTYGWRPYQTAYSLYSTPGWPDLALVKPPVVVLTELKTPSVHVGTETDTAGHDSRRSGPIPDGVGF